VGWLGHEDWPSGATGLKGGKLLGWGGGEFREIRLCSDVDDFK
jgi:hypothetical protein